MVTRLIVALVISLSAIGVQERGLAETGSDLEVAAFVIPQEIVPAKPGKHISILVALKVTNVSANTIVLNKFATPEVQLTREDGARLETINMGATVTFLPIRDFNRIATANDFIGLGHDDATYITTECSVTYFPDGQLYFRYQSRDGSVWKIGPLKTGTYQLALRYAVEKADAPAEPVKKDQKLTPWVGTILSRPIKFEIK